jgi:hypothetical protein
MLMNLYYFFTAILISCSAFQCDDGDPELEACGSFQSMLLDKDLDGIANHPVNFWLMDMSPVPVNGDQIGHQLNLELFVERLEEDCFLDAEIECYACIETLPHQSHVIIRMDSSNIQVLRTLDILTPADSVMTIRDIH